MAQAGQPRELVRSFLLVCQPDIERKADQNLIGHEATNPKTAEFFKLLRKGDAWTVISSGFPVATVG